MTGSQSRSPIFGRRKPILKSRSECGSHSRSVSSRGRRRSRTRTPRRKGRKHSPPPPPRSLPADAAGILKVIRDLPASENLHEDAVKFVAERLFDLGISGATIVGYTDAELADAWGRQAGVHQHLGGPGLPRLLVLEFAKWARRTYSKLDTPAKTTGSSRRDEPQLSPLDKNMVKAVGTELRKALRKDQRGKRDRDPEGLSDADENDRFDLGSFKGKSLRGTAGLIDSHWFGDLTRLRRLEKDAAHRKDGVPYLAFSPAEEWPPLWVGHTLSADARAEALKSRKKGPAASAALFLANSSCFWLSHAAAGLVSIQGVLGHLLLLIRLCDERGTTWAHSYSRALADSLQARIRDGEQFSLDAAIVQEDLDIMRRLYADADARRLRRETPGPGGPKGGGKGSERRRPGAPAAPSADDAAAAAPAPPPGERRRGVCFLHDPASGASCPKKKDCPHEHLDTKQTELAERFKRAKAAHEKAKASRAKKTAARASGAVDK